MLVSAFERHLRDSVSILVLIVCHGGTSEIALLHAHPHGAVLLHPQHLGILLLRERTVRSHLAQKFLLLILANTGGLLIGKGGKSATRRHLCVYSQG